ncbi:MAG: hypothetical protein GXX88_10605, partial [Candidatus Hydrogenedentes bacterium]|nr:hypothetical protein [Candidatus Hydrogenedentota bacterium]
MAGLFCLAAAGQNLLMNPSAETGDLSGWVILEAPGGGWSAGPGPYGLDRELDDERDGCAMFFTDGSVATDDLLWCRRSQTVDLLALGYTVGELDAAPDITVSEWFRGFSTRFIPNYSDTAYLKVELRGEDGTTIVGVPYDSGEFTTGGTWQHITHTFSGYGPGVRYIYWEDGGKAAEQYGSTDGPVLDEAFLTINIPSSTAPEITVSTALLDFGTFPRTGSWSDPQIITIYNTGNGEMEVNFCICKGFIDDFAFQNVPANEPIPPGGSLDLEVIFRPVTIGPRQATLRIYSDDPDEPTTEVLVLGFGAPVCSGVTRADASPTAATSVRFHVKFTEDVSGVDAADFTLVESGVSGSSIAQVADVDEGNPGNGVGADW